VASRGGAQERGVVNSSRPAGRERAKAPTGGLVAKQPPMLPPEGGVAAGMHVLPCAPYQDTRGNLYRLRHLSFLTGGRFRLPSGRGAPPCATPRPCCGAPHHRHSSVLGCRLQSSSPPSSSPSPPGSHSVARCCPLRRKVYPTMEPVSLTARADPLPE